MNAPCLRPAPFLLAIFHVFLATATAQVPNALLRSLFDPGTNAQALAGQGYSVAVDGNHAVVGVPSSDVGGAGSGVVKVYDAATGALLHTLTNPSPASYDAFGISVAISATRVVVGALGDNTGASDAGSAYVYDLAGATPAVPVLTLTNPSPASGEQFACSVGISGTRVAVGAHWDDTGARDAGSAYVFDLVSATPTVPVLTLTNPSPVLLDSFGDQVAISGTRVVVGTPSDDSGAANAGSAYVYDLASATPKVPVATLNNPSPEAYDNFGNSVAISGTQVVVGAYQNSAGAFEAGSAYVYDLSSATPTVPVRTLNNPSPAESELFGASVAISGTRVAVGVSQGMAGVVPAGSAHVYDLAGATPTVPVFTLTNPSPAPYDNFGISVAISGTRLVIGASEDDTLAEDAGSAYLYNLSNPAPTTPVAALNHPSPAADDNFGFSVALSGSRMVVGAPRDDTGAIDAGKVYVFDLAGVTPTVPVITLTNPSPTGGDGFGSSVAVSGTRLVIGAPGDDTGEEDAGSAFVFDLAVATPAVPVATLRNPSPAFDEEFGSRVAISGTRVVIGASADSTGALEAGSAYVYDLSSATPTVPVRTLTNPSPAEGDLFGFSVAISGTRVAVGAIGDSTGAFAAGSAYVYDLAGATPTVPVLTLTNPSPAVSDEFGFSVALSGTRVVVGAIGDSTGAVTAGSAYVYDLAGATPAVPVAALHNPNPAAGDNFGFAVALSGTRVVVGAGFDDGGVLDEGSACVYDLAGATPTVPVATLQNPSAAMGDNFGFAVAIDGATIVAGAPCVDTYATDRGAAYVFGPRPTLHIAPAAPGFSTLSWTPVTPSSFVLQWTDDLSSGSWSNAPSGALNLVNIPVTNAARYYRLIQQP